MEPSEPLLDLLLSTVFVIEMFISMETSCTYVNNAANYCYFESYFLQGGCEERLLLEKLIIITNDGGYGWFYVTR